MRNSSSLDWLRFMHTPNDYRVSHDYRVSPNFGMTNELRGVEKKSGESFSTFSASVPRPAFEILNINKRKQILFTTKFPVFTYV